MICLNFQLFNNTGFCFVSGTLAFGEARIVYKNGHFTFETMEIVDNDDDQTGSRGSDDNILELGTKEREVTQLVRRNSRETIRMHNKPLMRRQCGKAVLSAEDSHEDVFYSEADKLYHSQSSLSSLEQSQNTGKYDQNNDSNSSRMSQMSVDSCMSVSSAESSESGQVPQKLSSSSLPEVKDEEVRRVMQRAKRTSSFRQAQEVGSLRLSGIEEDGVHVSRNGSRNRSDSTGDRLSSEGSKSQSAHSEGQNAGSSTFVKKMMAKRNKSENLNLNVFTKQSESAKDFFSKKMTLKGLFKKNKSDSSVGTSSPLPADFPSTPPIAVFLQDDIGSADTPPTSPYSNREFRRRHTSANIYRSKPFPDSSETDSNCPTPTQERSNLRNTVSPPMTPIHDSSSGISLSSTNMFRDDDAVSMTSACSSASSSVQSPQMEQPNKPKTPKPVGASPRRNPSLTRMGSQTSMRARNNSFNSLDCESNMDYNRCVCDANRTMTLGRRRRKSATRFDQRGSSDSLTMCQYCKMLQASDEHSAKSTDKHKLRKRSFSRDRPDSGRSVKDTGIISGRVSYERLGIMSQVDGASSNSNDSGIQRDASVHSSTESLKVSSCVLILFSNIQPVSFFKS